MSSINKFLNVENSCSSEAQEFVLLAIEAFADGGEVDFEDRVVIDSSLENTQIKCVHDKLVNDSQDNFYKIMLSAFSGDFEVLRFEVGSVPNGEWGITSGNLINNYYGFDFYNITISNNIENTSNVSQLVTLSHELIHAFMFNSLDNLGVISYDSEGNPIFNSNQCTITSPNTDLNTLSIKDRWVALICAYNNNNPGSTDWTHDLFNTANFVVDTYRQELQNLIRNNHDWESESSILKNYLQTEFGSEWKDKASEYMSWRGLEETDDFATWVSNNNITTDTDVNGNTTYPGFSTVVGSIKNLGLSNCN